ncbi:hypothetical protein PAMP_010596 [Pampus punctatissimus]
MPQNRGCLSWDGVKGSEERDARKAWEREEGENRNMGLVTEGHEKRDGEREGREKTQRISLTEPLDLPTKKYPTGGNGEDEGLGDNPGWFHGATTEPFAAGLGPISELMSKPKPKASGGNQAT